MPYSIGVRDDEVCVVNSAQKELIATKLPKTNSRSVIILKGLSNKPRNMLLITSNGYPDRGKEVITVGALTKYVEDSWDGNKFTTSNMLNYRHRKEDIGKIIFADMEGPFLVELAEELPTPYSRACWDLIERTPDFCWGASHEFYGSTTDKKNGVYQYIYKVKTTVLPLYEAANSLTLAGVL